MITKETAIVILDQLGGNRFRVMVGATDFAYMTDEKGNVVFIFRFMVDNKLSANFCRITLTEMDLYTMEFLRVGNGVELDGVKSGVEVVERYDGLYCDMLESTFASCTGLITRLF